jgi:hypothetical protein
VLILTVGRIAMLLPVVFILAKLANVLLMVYGFKSNPWMKAVIGSKYSAQMPNDDGTFGPKAASKGVTVFLIGAKSNQ